MAREKKQRRNSTFDNGQSRAEERICKIEIHSSAAAATDEGLIEYR